MTSLKLTYEFANLVVTLVVIVPSIEWLKFIDLAFGWNLRISIQ